MVCHTTMFLIYICRYDRYLDVGVSRLSIGAESRREAREKFVDPRENYFKYLIARHPLERLGSAYSYMSRNRQNIQNHTIRKRPIAQVMLRKVDKLTQQTLDAGPTLVYCWASVVDGGRTVNQRWANVSCLLGYYILVKRKYVSE